MNQKNIYTLIAISLVLALTACSGGSAKPTVKLSASATALEDGQEVVLSAAVSGSIAKVEFFRGNEKVGEVAFAPYQLSLAVASNEDVTFSFTAKATAKDAQFVLSEPLSVSVKVDKEAPKVLLVASSSSLSAAGAVTLSANATDNKGVVKVEFFKGPDKLGEDTTPADGFSLVVDLSATENGYLKYKAKAHDKKGNVGESAEVGVSVDIRGSLTITISGLTRTAANVGLTGPDGYSKNLTATTTLDELKPGTYTLTPANVKSGHYTYAAEGSAVVVEGGNTANATASYAAINGALSLAISGLPDSTNGNVTVTGPDGYSQNLTATATLDNLKPGSYTLSPSDVEDTDYDYGASTSTVAVAAGNMANSTVSYAATTGSLSLSITPPPTETPSVRVMGPNSFDQTFTTSSVLKKIRAGNYTLTASNIDSGNYSYGAAISTVSVSNGAIANGTSSYAAITGALTVSIAGLPAGQSVSVTGPNSYSTSLSATTTLPRLPAGSYTLTAPTVSGYKSTLTGNPATVTVGDTASASVSMEVIVWTQMIAGARHNCGLRSDAKVYCWGRNNAGQLGIGNYTDKNTPVALSLPSGVSFSGLVGGFNHTCAIGSDNKTYCWGGNENGQLGIGSTLGKSTPTAVSLPAGVSFSQLASGFTHTCALGSDNKVYCWGYNLYGQLGDGSNTDKNTPVEVSLPSGVGFSQLAGGASHTCALGSDNQAYCWGNNFSAQLGDGSITNKNIPTAVSLPSGVSFTRLVSGTSHTCALGSDSKTYCWGSNAYGQLGNGGNSGSTPATVNLTSGVAFSTLVAGGYHTCALGSDSKAYCWGYNYSGQLGDGSNTNKNIPAAVSLPSGATFGQLAMGEYHGCAMASDNKVYCWGYNLYGQLGDGSNTDKNTPVAVNSP